MAQQSRIPPTDPNSFTPLPSSGGIGASGSGSSGAALGVPQFDPYASSPGAAYPPTNPYSRAPVYGQPAWGQPLGNTPPGVAPPPDAAVYSGSTQPWRNPGFGTTTPNPYPSQTPSSLFPDGFNGWGTGGPSGEPPLRLFENLRGRQTFVAGSDGREMSINDSELATTLQFPSFLGSGQALQISPGFAIHLWDGPQPPSLADMPGAAYSAFVEGAYRTDPAKSFGGDVTLSVGVYSDFNAIITESIRIQSYAFGWLRITPALMLKLGVNYIDRVDLALLPIIGLYWEPAPQIKLDITFPRPKLSRSLGTVGNTDYWIYLAAEYGGGSWTIQRVSGVSDQVDIDDVRLALGLDFTCQTGLRGYFEVGWVTQRRLQYRYVPSDDESLRDSYMLRLGFIY